MSYYSRPIAGKGFIPFSKSRTVDVLLADVKDYQFLGLIFWKKEEYARYKNHLNEEVWQTLRSIRWVRLRPGEDNINSKLTNNQTVELWEAAVAGASRQELADKYQISVKSVNQIVNFRQRRTIILNHLNGIAAPKAQSLRRASPLKGKKLSPGLAGFIRKDHVDMKLNTKALAHKYCVSRRTIQRVLKGEMYR